MKWWHWLVLELLIIFGVMAWIYFFPSEIEDDFAKGMIGFVLIYAIEQCKDIKRRKTMDYKEGMTCGECLKYVYCPVANHNTNHKACLKITTNENHTIEQNAGENRKEKQYRPFNDCNELIEHYQKKYKSAVGCDIYFPSLYKPNIWVKRYEHTRDVLMNRTFLITGYEDSGVVVDNKWIGMDKLFEKYKFLDDSPVGKRDDERDDARVDKNKYT